MTRACNAMLSRVGLPYGLVCQRGIAVQPTGNALCMKLLEAIIAQTFCTASFTGALCFWVFCQ